MGIEGRKALVTGAASGIGRATALALFNRNVEVCALDIDQAGLHDLRFEADENGSSIHLADCDLADPNDVDRCLADVTSKFGVPDIVVNNAGIVYYGPLEEMTDQQWDRIMQVNLLAPSLIIRRLLPQLQQLEKANIVNISSFLGLVGMRKLAAYSLTKSAMIGLGEALYSELAKHNITVTTVCPGFVATDIYRNTMTSDGNAARRPKRWMMTPADVVVNRIVRAIERNKPFVAISILTRLCFLAKRISPTLWMRFTRAKRRVESKSPELRPRKAA